MSIILFWLVTSTSQALIGKMMYIVQSLPSRVQIFPLWINSTQVIEQLTDSQWNTLDLVCTTNPTSLSFITLNWSRMFIYNCKWSLSCQFSSRATTKQVNSKKELLCPIMKWVAWMKCGIFHDQLRKVVNASVPKQSTEILMTNTRPPPISFYLVQYKEEPHSHKNQLRTIQQDYITNRVCKPLQYGNGKPFYRRIKYR